MVGEVPGLRRARVSCSDHSNAVRFLDLAKVAYNPNSAGFQLKEVRRIDNRAILDFVSTAGLRLRDPNDDRPDIVLSRKAVDKSLRERKGRAYRAIVHLGTIYGHRVPRHSSLACSVRDGTLQIDVAGWYSLTFQETPPPVRVLGIEYLEIEDL
jgi:hypothetical protein